MSSPNFLSTENSSLAEALSKRLAQVQENIIAAATRAGRNAAEIELVAISKKQPEEMIREVIEEGVTLFGESRLQEASMKIPLLPARTRWHFIGHIQKNKIRKLLPLFELFHSVDTLALAEEMDHLAEELGLFPRVLLEVNVSGEKSKYGFSPEEIEQSLEKLLRLPRLQVEGFMTMAPLAKDPEASRPFFARLRLLRDRMAIQTGIALSTLSMGMSNDYQIAIEEGATLVRVGSAIFRETSS